MQRIGLFLSMCFLMAFSACSHDNNHDDPLPAETGIINLSMSGRVGAVIGDELTSYVKSLDLLLFREGNDGVYTLLKTQTLTKEQLLSLKQGTDQENAGFTKIKQLTFDNLPIGTYQIVGVGNIRDSVGTPFDNAALTGVTVGNNQSQVIAAITNGSVSPRLFYGTTAPIVLGTATPVNPSLTLYRKVAMFALTLEKVPAAVTQIIVEIKDTYGAFDMTGSFLSNNIITVLESNTYQFTKEQEQLPISLITLPTFPAKQSLITLTFYLDNGQVFKIPLTNQYTLKSNTITKLTATIDADQSGGNWKVDLTIAISADVEWNVDQEPPIII